MGLSVIIHHSDGSTTDASQHIQNMTLDKSLNSIDALDLTISNYENRYSDVIEGDEIDVELNGVNFRGFIREIDASRMPEDLSVKAYSGLEILKKKYTPQRESYEDQYASDIISDLLSDTNISDSGVASMNQKITITFESAELLDAIDKILKRGDQNNEVYVFWETYDSTNQQWVLHTRSKENLGTVHDYRNKTLNLDTSLDGTETVDQVTVVGEQRITTTGSYSEVIGKAFDSSVPEEERREKRVIDRTITTKSEASRVAETKFDEYSSVKYTGDFTIPMDPDISYLDEVNIINARTGNEDTFKVIGMKHELDSGSFDTKLELGEKQRIFGSQFTSIISDLRKMEMTPENMVTSWIPLSSDIIGYWSFREPRGDNVIDISGNGFDGTVNGDDAYRTLNSRVGRSIDMSASDYVEVQNASGLVPSGQITLGMFVSPDEVSTSGNLIDKENSYGLKINDGTPEFYLYDQGGSKHSISGGDVGELDKSEFKFVEGIMNASGMILSTAKDDEYQKVASNSESFDIQDSSTPLRFGEGIDGRIDQAQIYNIGLARNPRRGIALFPEAAAHRVADSAYNVEYSDGVPVEDLQPDEEGADKTVNALDKANYIDDTPPPSGQRYDGMLWFDTSYDGLFRWDKSEITWDLVSDLTASNIHRCNYSGPSAPTGAKEGWIWFDTEEFEYNRFDEDSDEWQSIADITNKKMHEVNYFGATSPTGVVPKDGWLWYDTDDHSFNRFNEASGKWFSVGDITGEKKSNDTAQVEGVAGGHITRYTGSGFVDIDLQGKEVPEDADETASNPQGFPWVKEGGGELRGQLSWDYDDNPRLDHDDIDALQTTNSPDEAGADVTGNNKANDTVHVEGIAGGYVVKHDTTNAEFVDIDGNATPVQEGADKTADSQQPWEWVDDPNNTKPTDNADVTGNGTADTHSETKTSDSYKYTGYDTLANTSGESKILSNNWETVASDSIYRYEELGNVFTVYVTFTRDSGDDDIAFRMMSDNIQFLGDVYGTLGGSYWDTTDTIMKRWVFLEDVYFKDGNNIELEFKSSGSPTVNDVGFEIREEDTHNHDVDISHGHSLSSG